MRPDLIVIGASWGGLDALQKVLRSLPADYPVPIAVVQHRGKDGDGALVEVLQRSCALRVIEIEDKQPIEAGSVFLAPSDYHVLIDGNAFSLSIDPPVAWARPSIDVLFETAALRYRGGVTALILTGSGRDGVSGLCEVKEAGGLTLVQDPVTAEARSLPDAAIIACNPHHVVPLEAIAPFLVRLSAVARRAS